jgi:hypothetical protein
MNGFLDPFNRGTFKEEPYGLVGDYRRFARLRRSADALRTGHAVFYAPNPDCIAVLRYVTGGRDALGRAARDGAFLVAVNRSEMLRRFVLDFTARTPLFHPVHQAALRRLVSGGAVCRITGRRYAVKDGLLDMTVPGMSAVWLEFAFERDESVV